MIGLLIMGFGIVGILYALFHFKSRSGTITLPPSEGEVYMNLSFRPREVLVYFVDDNCEYPSCVELNDEIDNVRTLRHGFKFEYKIESGTRTIEWIARR